MSDTQRADLQQQLNDLRNEYDELERSLPRHSVKASQIMRLEELEDRIAAIEAGLAKLGGQGDTSTAG